MKMKQFEGKEGNSPVDCEESFRVELFEDRCTTHLKLNIIVYRKLISTVKESWKSLDEIESEICYL